MQNSIYRKIRYWGFLFIIYIENKYRLHIRTKLLSLDLFDIFTKSVRTISLTNKRPVSGVCFSGFSHKTIVKINKKFKTAIIFQTIFFT